MSLQHSTRSKHTKIDGTLKISRISSISFHSTAGGIDEESPRRRCNEIKSIEFLFHSYAMIVLMAIGQILPRIEADTRLTRKLRGFEPLRLKFSQKVLNERNQSKGYRFVGFKRNRDAVEAIHAMNGFHIDGKEIRVSWAANQRAETGDLPGGQSR
jgi:RNA recognition motif-containing protein